MKTNDPTLFKEIFKNLLKIWEMQGKVLTKRKGVLQLESKKENGGEK